MSIKPKRHDLILFFLIFSLRWITLELVRGVACGGLVGSRSMEAARTGAAGLVR